MMTSSVEAPVVVEVGWEEWRWASYWKHPHKWRRVICLFKGHFWRVLRIERQGIEWLLEGMPGLTEKQRATYVAHPEWIEQYPSLHLDDLMTLGSIPRLPSMLTAKPSVSAVVPTGEALRWYVMTEGAGGKDAH